MTEEPKRRLPRHGGRAARAFFWLTPDWRLRVYGFTIENEEKLRGPGRHSFGPEFDRRGVPAYPEPPRLLIDPKRGRPPSDCDWYGGYWIVSDKLKAVLDAVDPDACAFVKCDVRHAQGKATDGGYWLMDIVRNLDARSMKAPRGV
jgi:hypothetical protein